LLLDDSVVDALVHAVNHDGEQEAVNGPDVLEVDPVVHHSVVLNVALAFSISAEFWLLLGKNKPANINGETDSDEVVHLEEETESTLLHLVDLGEKLNELVHTLHAEINEHKPVDVLHVSCGILVV
jgi:hypothetical protein